MYIRSSQYGSRNMIGPAIAVATALMLLVAACGDGDAATTTTATTASTQTVTTDTTGQEGDEYLVGRWREDSVALGVEPLVPPPGDDGVTDTSQYAKDGPYRIAFASQGPTNAWAVLYEEVQRYHVENAYDDVELLYAGADGDAEKQLNDIEDLLAQQPDALIVTPMSAAVRGPIERAAAEGIPVIVCTGNVETDAYVTRIDRDNRLDGALLAEYLAKQINYEGKVVMLSGIAGVPTAEDRLASGRPVFDSYPDIEVIAQEYTNWSPTEGKRVMESLLVQYPEIDAIWSDSSSQMIGVMEAFAEAGRELPPITGEPLNGFLRLAIENGASFGAIGYPPDHSAQCIDAAVQTLQGIQQPKFTVIEAAVFTDERAEELYRPDCGDDLWVPSSLPDEVLTDLGLCS